MKILVRLPNWLGDVVMSTAFIAAAKQFYPDAAIDVIVKKELAEIAALIPGVHRVHPFSKHQHKGLAGVYRFGKRLRSEQYDIFFNLPSSLSSFVLGWASGAKKRVGFRKEGGIFLLTNAYKRPSKVHRVDEYISLLEQYTGALVREKEVKLIAEESPQLTQNKVLINFNSEAESRRMPVDKAIDITNLLTNTFKSTKLVFTGSPQDAAFIQLVTEGAENRGRIENVAGKTGLTGLVNLTSGCSAVLTTDSGPAHLANSLGIPTIVLFGAGDEKNTAPYNKLGLSVIRAGKLSCEPCVKNTCELYGIPKCMQLLPGLQIINTLSVYLPHA